jgi:putative transcriptional regulator
VANRIEAHRERAGLTQAEVAERAGLDLKNYQRTVSGKRNTSLEMLTRIANAIGCRVDSFFDTPSP